MERNQNMYQELIDKLTLQFFPEPLYLIEAIYDQYGDSDGFFVSVNPRLDATHKFIVEIVEFLPYDQGDYIYSKNDEYDFPRMLNRRFARELELWF